MLYTETNIILYINYILIKKRKTVYSKNNYNNEPLKTYASLYQNINKNNN